MRFDGSIYDSNGRVVTHLSLILLVEEDDDDGNIALLHAYHNLACVRELAVYALRVLVVGRNFRNCQTRNMSVVSAWPEFEAWITCRHLFRCHYLPNSVPQQDVRMCEIGQIHFNRVTT